MGDARLDDDAYSAREVGTRPGRRTKAPGVAALLSLLAPGLGQAWLGAARRGLFLAAPVIVGLAALLGFVAGGDRKTLVDAFLRPGVILALLVAIIGLGIYHVIAIQDAYRLGLRREREASLRAAGRRLFRSPVLAGALAIAVALYGTLAVVGVGAYEATSAIFVKPTPGSRSPSRASSRPLRRTGRCQPSSLRLSRRPPPSRCPRGRPTAA